MWVIELYGVKKWQIPHKGATRSYGPRFLSRMSAHRYVREFYRCCSWSAYAKALAFQASGQTLLRRASIITRSASRALSLAVLAMLAFHVSVIASEAQTELKLSVNDISYLWPVPTTQAEVDMLIDGESVWPDPSFEAVLNMALGVQVKDGGGTTRQITFPPAAHFDDRVNWKLVGFRVDPSAPSTDPFWIKRIGSIPQVRLIMQPVTVTSNGVAVHDFTAHIAFNYVLNSTPPFDPDRTKFAAILDDLLELKSYLLAVDPPVSTEGELRVNPGLGQNVSGFSAKVEDFLHKHLANLSPALISFMGVSSPTPEPWIFFAWDPTKSKATGTVMLFPAITVRDGSVTPVPKNSNLEPDPPIGVSTAVLFRSAPDLNGPAIPGRTKPLNRDIPDIVANPTTSNVLNTDCVSCHSETTRRTILELPPSEYQYELPDGIPGVKPSLLPTTNYNVRNFGWYQLGVAAPQIAVTIRASNETADALEFIRKEYQR
jgi:hypothetical protein